jgi:hypothetical protein
VASTIIALVATVPSRPSPALAAASTTQTDHFAGISESTPYPNPCSGIPSELRETWGGIVHDTFRASGDWMDVNAIRGTISFVPDDPSQPSYSGRFTQVFGSVNNHHTYGERGTFSGSLTGTDGSTVRMREDVHVSVSATGVTVEFDNVSLTCS